VTRVDLHFDGPSTVLFALWRDGFGNLGGFCDSVAWRSLDTSVVTVTVEDSSVGKVALEWAGEGSTTVEFAPASDAAVWLGVDVHSHPAQVRVAAARPDTRPRRSAGGPLLTLSGARVQGPRPAAAAVTVQGREEGGALRLQIPRRQVRR
jgi:hypothetical protein